MGQREGDYGLKILCLNDELLRCGVNVNCLPDEVWAYLGYGSGHTYWGLS